MSAAASVELKQGSAAIPQAESTIEPSTKAEMDAAVATLRENAAKWQAVTVQERIALLEQLIETTAAQAERWVREATAAKKIPAGTPQVGEEWLGGPVVTVRNLRLLKSSLEDIAKYGRPLIPGPVRTLPNGQVAAQVMPTGLFDKVLFQGFTGEIWMEPGVTADRLFETQAVAYRDKRLGQAPEPKVALVLGAGNVSSIGPMDALYKFFVEDQVVVLKTNPVNEYIGPITADCFKLLVDRGFLRICYGGAKEGAYLCQHDGIDEIHITGSDKTHDAIVYGVGKKGATAKKKDKPINNKRITSELGNVSPVIVVPGPWKPGDLEFQGQNLASMLTNNAGFNCNATRVIVTHESWSQRQGLLDQVRRTLANAPTRQAYYPGAADRWQAFVDAHPTAEQYGRPEADHLPWTLVSNLDPSNANEICFTTEAFCGVFGEVALEGSDVVDYIDKAVDFANDTVWGSLNCSVIVHPESLKDRRVADAVERAIQNLRHGSVVINHWAALAYGFVSTTWGAHPGHTVQDIRSGVGVVHNTYMFDRPQKTVIRGPFIVKPTPPWFVNHKTTPELGRKLTHFEAEPDWKKIPSILWSAIRG